MQNLAGAKEMNHTKVSAVLEKRFSDRPHTPVALLSIAFNDLSDLNASFGFDADNRIAGSIDKKIASLLQVDDFFVKTGNGRYLIAQALQKSTDPETLAREIVQRFAEPCVMGEQMFFVYLSVGISLFPLNARDPYELIKRAENAAIELQKEKKNGIRFAKEEPSDILSDKKAQIMADIPAAIDSGEIYFVYQAQYSHQKECFSGAEILARWKHPYYGTVAPDFFIPLAEQSGMIGSLTVRSLVAAAKAHDRLRAEGVEDFSLSVNISPAFLMTNTFYQTIRFLADEYDLPGKPIHFEITEAVLMRHSQSIVTILEEIEELGIRIELDDYGTGYTSLQHLASLPIHILKIDRSFIHNADKESRKRALLKAIMDMAQALGMQVVAEGVETEEEDRSLRQLGPVIVQGYYYAKPVPLDVLIRQIASQSKSL
jgi:EAL domain-containing protein (putative c-di-GMP-specific phosphodiesterase class I)/GGDEF domain-containing protein